VIQPSRKQPALRAGHSETSWNRLFQMLRDGFSAERYHLARELSRLEQNGAEVIAHFSDGSSATGDLLVGARAISAPICRRSFTTTRSAGSPSVTARRRRSWRRRRCLISSARKTLSPVDLGCSRDPP